MAADRKETVFDNKPVDIDDNDWIYAPDLRKTSDTKTDSLSEYFLSILALTVLCCMSILAILFHLIRRKRLAKSPLYQILVQLFVCIALILVAKCVEANVTVINSGYRFITHKTHFTCVMSECLPLALEACNSVQVLFIWLIVMSERNLADLKCLYNDFRLKKAMKAGESATAEDLLILERKNVRQFKNFIHIYCRWILLGFFYLLVFFIFILFTTKSYTRLNYGFYFCASNISPILHALIHLSYWIFFLPLFYMFILVPLVFGKFFGGERDPLLSQLSESDKRMLKFLRIVTVLKAIDQVLMHAHASTEFHFNPNVQKFFRILGMLLTLVILFLFAYYDNALGSFEDEEENNSRCPTTNTTETSGGSNGIANIFKRIGQNSKEINYSYLIENEER